MKNTAADAVESVIHQSRGDFHNVCCHGTCSPRGAAASGGLTLLPQLRQALKGFL